MIAPEAEGLLYPYSTDAHEDAIAGAVERAVDTTLLNLGLEDEMDTYDFVSSKALPGLAKVPGKQNWIEHLPAPLRAAWKKSWIYRAAKHLHWTKGMSVGRAIAVAINAARKGAATGDLNFPGIQQVNVKSRAEMVAALATWASMKAANKAKKAVNLSGGSVSLDLADAYMALTVLDPESGDGDFAESDSTSQSQRAKNFDESKYKRESEGTPIGGRFAKKNGGSSKGARKAPGTSGKARFTDKDGDGKDDRQLGKSGMNKALAGLSPEMRRKLSIYPAVLGAIALALRTGENPSKHLLRLPPELRAAARRAGKNAAGKDSDAPADKESSRGGSGEFQTGSKAPKKTSTLSTTEVSKLRKGGWAGNGQSSNDSLYHPDDPRNAESNPKASGGSKKYKPGMSARQIADLPDEERFKIPMSKLPPPPKGSKWAEDRTYVGADFSDGSDHDHGTPVSRSGRGETGVQSGQSKYDKPAIREELKRKIMASDKGGPAGQWTARKAMLLTAAYEKAGGGYRTDKGGKDSSQKSLESWKEAERREIPSSRKPTRKIPTRGVRNLSEAVSDTEGFTDFHGGVTDRRKISHSVQHSHGSWAASNPFQPMRNTRPQGKGARLTREKGGKQVLKRPADNRSGSVTPKPEETGSKPATKPATKPAPKAPKTGGSGAPKASGSGKRVTMPQGWGPQGTDRPNVPPKLNPDQKSIIRDGVARAGRLARNKDAAEFKDTMARANTMAGLRRDAPPEETFDALLKNNALYDARELVSNIGALARGGDTTTAGPPASRKRKPASKPDPNAVPELKPADRKRVSEGSPGGTWADRLPIKSGSEVQRKSGRRGDDGPVEGVLKDGRVVWKDQNGERHASPRSDLLIVPPNQSRNKPTAPAPASKPESKPAAPSGGGLLGRIRGEPEKPKPMKGGVNGKTRPFMARSVSDDDDISFIGKGKKGTVSTNRSRGEDEGENTLQGRQDAEERKLRGQNERQSRANRDAMRKLLRGAIDDQGGIAPPKKQSEEFRLLPSVYKNRNGLPADVMADYLRDNHPELGVKSEDDLFEAINGARRDRANRNFSDLDDALIAHDLAEAYPAIPESDVALVANVTRDLAARTSVAIPADVAAAARRGLDMRKRYGRGGTDVGLATARTLAAGGSISPGKVLHVARYFARHAGDNLTKKPGEDPSNGMIAWLLWGGNAGRRFAEGYRSKLHTAVDKRTRDRGSSGVHHFQDDKDKHGYSRSAKVGTPPDGTNDMSSTDTVDLSGLILGALELSETYGGWDLPLDDAGGTHDFHGRVDARNIRHGIQHNHGAWSPNNPFQPQRNTRGIWQTWPSRGGSGRKPSTKPKPPFKKAPGVTPKKPEPIGTQAPGPPVAKPDTPGDEDDPKRAARRAAIRKKLEKKLGKVQGQRGNGPEPGKVVNITGLGTPEPPGTPDPPGADNARKADELEKRLSLLPQGDLRQEAENSLNAIRGPATTYRTLQLQEGKLASQRSKAPTDEAKNLVREILDLLDKEAVRRREGGAPGPVPTKPVGEAIDHSKAGKFGKISRRTQDLIDKVHSDGRLPPLTVKPSKARSYYGQYQNKGGDHSIRISDFSEGTSHDHPELTYAHELGHFLDHMGLRDPKSYGGRFASEALRVNRSKPQAVMKAIDDSAATKNLQETAALKRDMWGNPISPGDPKGYIDRKYVGYMLTSREKFARAYAQYIAEKSDDPRMKAQVRTINNRGNAAYPDKQWADEDFVPIRNAFDQMFREEGWLK